MSLDPQMMAGFRDEFVKIAGLGASVMQGIKSVPGHLQSAIGAGWNETGGWTGAGKITSKLPVGNKALSVLGTAAMLPGAVSAEDPSGQGRTRAERVTGLTGNVLGGLAATGALARTGVGKALLTSHPILTNIAAGVGGGLLGERLLAAPFSHARKAEQQRQYQDMVPSQNQVASGFPGRPFRAAFSQ